jgi:hypothetical protein
VLSGIPLLSPGGPGRHGCAGVRGAADAGFQPAEHQCPRGLHELRLGGPSFFAKLAAGGFSFDRLQEAGVAREQGSSPAETLKHFDAIQTSVKGSNLLIGTKRRIAGLSLRATDADWRHGTGPEVSGPMLALLMDMTGRKAATGDLTGDGVATARTVPLLTGRNIVRARRPPGGPGAGRGGAVR